MGYSINEIEAVPAVPAKKVLSVDGKDIATSTRGYGTDKWTTTLIGSGISLYISSDRVEKLFNWLGKLISPAKSTSVIFSEADLDLAPLGSVWIPAPLGDVTGIYRRAADGWEYSNSLDPFHGSWNGLRFGPTPSAYPLLKESE